MNRLLRWCLLLTLAFSGGASATSYAPPKRQEIFSGNREFLLVVDPKTKIHKISPASAPNDTRWKFELPVWHFPFVLSNDGRTVAVVAWEHIKEDSLATGDCVTFFSADGTQVGVPFSEVYPNPPKTSQVGVGPIGDFWRTWYRNVETDGDLLVIHTTGGGTATFDLNRRALVAKRGVGLFKPSHLVLGGLGLIALVIGGWIRHRRKNPRSRTSRSR